MTAASPLTIAVLGCGVLGTAIVTGVLASLEKPHLNTQEGQFAFTNKRLDSDLTPKSSDEELPLDRPIEFIACVRTTESAIRVQKDIARYATPVTVLQGQNLKAVSKADVVVLGCLPHQMEECIGDSDIRRALRGKLLVSLLAGVTIEQIEYILDRQCPGQETMGAHQCRIVRAMPNTASSVQDSMTVVTTNQSDPQTLRLVHWLFGSIGEVFHISSDVFDACTALCGSGPAFYALVLEAMVDAAVSLGVKRAEAQLMAAYTMRGTASMIASGEHPAVVREGVASPGGSTMVGLLKLEERCARSAIANSLIECAHAAQKSREQRRAS